MTGGSKKQESRQQEISEISRSLKALAREINAPVIALSQLSRACETRRIIARCCRIFVSPVRRAGCGRGYVSLS